MYAKVKGVIDTKDAIFATLIDTVK